MDEFLHGKWKKGLFELDPMLYVQTYCCLPCTVSEIHALKHPDFCGLNKCLACCLPIKPCQVYAYGQKMVPDQKPITAICKIWCCGLCYVAQEYYEATAGTTKGMGDLVKTIGKPGQIEMS